MESFITGASNFLTVFKIPPVIGSSLIAVFIVSFANTTLDSAARIQRLTFQELVVGKKNDKSIFNNRYLSTIIVIVCAAIMTFLEPGGKGALKLWPLFGSLNQLLAALGLAVVSVYLYRKGKNVFLAFIPMLFVLVMTIWSVLKTLILFFTDKQWTLTIISLIIISLTLWLLVAAMFSVKVTLKRKL